MIWGETNSVRVNSVKKSARITNLGGYYEKILSTVANLRSYTNTTDNTTYSFLRCILDLSSETLKDDFFRLGREISDFPDLKKCTFAVEIAHRWGKRIIEDWVIAVAKVEDGFRERVIRISEGWADYISRGVLYRLLLPLICIHETGLPKNIPIRMEVSMIIVL